MNEKYRKYIKNIPFIELFYNINFVKKQNKEFYEKVKPIMTIADETKQKNIKRNLLVLNLIIWGVNIIMPLLMFFSGFFGFLILHNLEIYLIFLSLPASYYSLSIYKDSLEELEEKSEQFEQLKKLPIKELVGTNATMVIWNYAYLSIGILIAMFI